jgi:hypothetical protein
VFAIGDSITGAVVSTGFFRVRGVRGFGADFVVSSIGATMS